MWWPPQCEECSAEMTRRDEERKEREATERRERETGASLRLLTASGLPPAYIRGKRGKADLDSGPHTDGYLVARKTCARLVTGNLVDDRGLPVPWVYLYGPNGSYKSTLACCALLEVISLGRAAKYVLWPDALDELRGLNRDDACETVSQYVRRLVEIPHLVIDEIGLGTPTPFAAEKLFVVLERRYQEDSAVDPGERSTIFTSNRSASELAETFSHIDDGLGARRLARRISDMATAINVAA